MNTLAFLGSLILCGAIISEIIVRLTDRER